MSDYLPIEITVLVLFFYISERRGTRCMGIYPGTANELNRAFHVYFINTGFLLSQNRVENRVENRATHPIFTTRF